MMQIVRIFGGAIGIGGSIKDWPDMRYTGEHELVQPSLCHSLVLPSNILSS